MKPSIGIIGGAGPLAGALLFEMIIKEFQKRYGCYLDADFPYIILHNIPFVNMLEDPDEERVRSQLEEGLALLEKNGVERVAIACNTLHAFLPEKKWKFDFFDLRSVVNETSDDILVLCTAISRKMGVFDHLKKKSYLKEAQESELEQLIARIKIGKVNQKESSFFSALIEQDKKKCVLLGCTELSLLHTRFPLSLPGVHIIDPLQLLAETLCSQD